MTAIGGKLSGRARGTQKAAREATKRLALTLGHEGALAVGAKSTLRVAVPGGARVELTALPSGGVALSRSAVSRTGTVAVRGLAHGTTSLFARAFAGDALIEELRVDLFVEGPDVQLLGFGYEARA